MGRGVRPRCGCCRVVELDTHVRRSPTQPAARTERKRRERSDRGVQKFNPRARAVTARRLAPPCRRALPRSLRANLSPIHLCRRCRLLVARVFACFCSAAARQAQLRCLVARWRPWRMVVCLDAHLLAALLTDVATASGDVDGVLFGSHGERQTTRLTDDSDGAGLPGVH